MRLYTQQPKSVWEQVQQTNDFVMTANHPDSFLTKADNDDARKAYQWMTQALTDRVDRPEKAQTPVWWWLAEPNEHPHVNHQWDNSQADVIIEADIDYFDCLFTDFQMWSVALLGMYIHPVKSETTHQWAETEDWLDSLPDDVKQQHVIDSWQFMIGIHPNARTQAVTWTIPRDAVISVHQ